MRSCACILRSEQHVDIEPFYSSGEHGVLLLRRPGTCCARSVSLINTLILIPPLLYPYLLYDTERKGAPEQHILPFSIEKTEILPTCTLYFSPLVRVNDNECMDESKFRFLSPIPSTLRFVLSNIFFLYIKLSFSF